MKRKVKNLNKNGDNLFSLFNCAEINGMFYKEKVLNNELTQSDIELYIRGLILDTALLIKYSIDMGLSVDIYSIILPFEVALDKLIDIAKTDEEREYIIDRINYSLNYDEKNDELKTKLKENNEKLKEINKKLKEYLDKNKGEN